MVDSVVEDVVESSAAGVVVSILLDASAERPTSGEADCAVVASRDCEVAR